MAGIVAYGSYIPFFRLARAEIARNWGIATQPGEKAVASYDEDSLTMAVAAALDCVKGIDMNCVDGLYFASTTSPYKEKQCAATISTILGIPATAITMDFGGSLRSGTNALKAAADAVNSGSARNILVCAADSRLGYPSGAFEMAFGDGAAALLIGKKDTIAEIIKFYSNYRDIQDVWRSDRDQFVRSGEDRFSMDEGYTAGVSETVTALLKQSGLKAADFNKAALYAPNARQLAAMAQKLGFDPKTQVPDNLHQSVGDTGSANALLSLINIIEKASQGEKMLLASYGNGCDAFILETTALVAGNKKKTSLQSGIKAKSLVTNYSKFLRWRELVTTQPAARPPLEERQPTPSAQWRESQWELRLTGTKCKHCGTPQYPKQRVCINCGTKDEYEAYTFFDKPAKAFSFSHDYVMASVEPPVTVTIVDFEGGGRLMCDMTDRVPEEIKVGIPLEMTFRRLYYVGGIYNYWWKCKPVRV